MCVLLSEQAATGSRSDLQESIFSRFGIAELQSSSRHVGGVSHSTTFGYMRVLQVLLESQRYAGVAHPRWSAEWTTVQSRLAAATVPLCSLAFPLAAQVQSHVHASQLSGICALSRAAVEEVELKEATMMQRLWTGIIPSFSKYRFSFPLRCRVSLLIAQERGQQRHPRPVLAPAGPGRPGVFPGCRLQGSLLTSPLPMSPLLASLLRDHVLRSAAAAVVLHAEGAAGHAGGGRRGRGGGRATSAAPQTDPLHA